MKRLSVVILIVSLMLTLSACGLKQNKLLEADTPVYESKKLVFVTEKDEYSTTDTEISFTITNTGKSESAIAAEGFELQYKTDEGFKTVAFKKEVYFNALARVLAPQEVFEKTINLEDYFYLPLDAGEYRILWENLPSNTFKIKD